MSCLKTYYQSLPTDKKSQFSDRSGLKRNYIEKRLMYGLARPSFKAMYGMADASNGELSDHDVFDFFRQFDGRA